MDFTPIIPTNLSGELHTDITKKAKDVYSQTLALKASFSPLVIKSLKDMLRIVNCYYSNKIESEGTHPVNIEKAMKDSYAKDEKNRHLQKLALSYIKTQKLLEQKADISNVYTLKFLTDIHKHFYESDDMKPFLDLKNENGTIYQMNPGKIRDLDVAVGNHIPPSYSQVPSMLNSLLHLYSLEKHCSYERQLVAALSSHHRLSWIHPFADGNGRTTRLMLDANLGVILGESYGLWNISMGLARNLDEYKSHLKMADLPKLDSHDGKGYLSQKYLHEFVNFMLDTALDQIKYMSSCLRLDNLANRIDSYIDYKRSVMMEKVPKGVEAVLKELLLKGEIKRGDVQKIVNVSPRTANSIVSWMLKDELVNSPSQKGVLHINFNSKMSTFLFPELIPVSIY